MSPEQSAGVLFVFFAFPLLILSFSNLGLEKKFGRATQSQNFLEVAYLSGEEARRGISSCLFIHSNQESVEQQRRLGSEGPLPH